MSDDQGRSALAGARSRAFVLRTLGVAVALAAAWLALLPGDTDRGLAAVANPYEVLAVQTSADLSQRLTAVPAPEFETVTPPHVPVINVNAGIRYQTVQGFGAAMTDSSAWLIERGLSQTARLMLMSALFGPSGIDLDFVKIPMGASDFTRGGQPYTYDDLPPGRSDPTLAHFSIAHDRAYIMPALQEARFLDPTTEFLATPWTSPAWMKTNHSLGNAGNRGTLVRSDYRAWAEYFVKMIRAYAKAGIPISAVTPQNEPGIATLYPGMNFSPSDEAAWVAQDLRPALAQAKLAPRIYGGDVGWGPSPAETAASAHNQAKSALSGVAWHCYYGAPTIMGQLHVTHPGLEQIVDECSPGISPTPIPEIVIGSLRNWASAVALWNLALNPSGGPVQPPNQGCMGCQGLATIDPSTGSVSLNQNYYELGQASEFVQPGARRILSGHFVSYRYPHPNVSVVTPGLDDVALRNPDGSIVLIAYDNSPAPTSFAVAWAGRSFSYTLPAGAMVTFVWNRP